MRDLLARVQEALDGRSYKTALQLLSADSLEERRLNPNDVEAETMARLKKDILQNQFMDEFRAINTKAEELYAAGKLDPARIEFDRALALISSERARGIVPPDRRDESMALLKTKITAIAQAQKGLALWSRLKAERANKDPLKIIQAIDAIIAFQGGDPRNAALIKEKTTPRK